MIRMQATIFKIKFRSPDNSWTSLILQDDKGNKHQATGILPFVNEGSLLDIEGSFKEDDKYGKQIIIKKFSELTKVDKNGIINFLSSGFLKGIGPSTAENIYKKFGDQTYKVLDESPEKFLKIKGITPKKLDNIVLSWKERQEAKKLYDLLGGSDISIVMCEKIRKKFKGADAIDKIRSNPYILTTVDGIGFIKADHYARNSGICPSPEDKRRFEAGIIHTLKENADSSGDSFMYLEDLSLKATKLLGGREDLVVNCLRQMVSNNNENSLLVYREIGEKHAFYFKKHYQLEIKLAKEIQRLNSQENKLNYSESLERTIEEFKRDGFELSTEQREAVDCCLANNFHILTGGPGTGKSTITKVVVETLKKINSIKIRQCALAGRAASRLSEVTGNESSTIHRLLQFQGEGFVNNKLNPLEADVLIVDECSMITLSLFYSLLSAIKTGTKILLIGDVDQLESVGVGDVFRDLTMYHKVSKSILTKIFRQAEDSPIIKLAHAVNKKQDLFLKKQDPDQAHMVDCAYVSVDNMDNYTEYISRLYSLLEIDGETQILSPMKKSDVGVESLNLSIQNTVNPEGLNKKEIKFGKTVFRINDRVIHIKNNYDLDAFNGDIGKIIEVSDSYLVVDYQTKQIKYKKNQLIELSLAYAITIHKSQGSEFSKVIIPVFNKFMVLLSKKLLYTGITRAKKQLILVGEYSALMMCANKDARVRNTYLLNLLLTSEDTNIESQSAS